MGRSGYAVRMTVVACGIIAAFILLASHLYVVQITRHEELYAKAKKKYTAVKTCRGTRGEVFDVNGNLLVGNIPCIDIRADPQMISDDSKCHELAGFFARYLDVPPDVIFHRLSEKTRNEKPIREVVIKNAVPFDQAKKIIKESAERNYKGVFFVDSGKRYYPKNELLSNVLGFVNMDDVEAVPVIGVEKAYHNVLAPVKTRASVFERSRKGIPLTYGQNSFYEAKPGKNIYLTISEPIQTIIEEELDKLVEKWTPKAAYAVMVDPKTGSIIAMAQRPSFNPNDRGNMNPSGWTDRLITSGFEPGSSMKPLVVAGALDNGVVSPGTQFDCENGNWFYAGKILRDAHRMSVLPVSQIIQKSSNIGTAKIAIQLGQDRLYDLFKRYGFGRSTGIPLKPEATGIFRDQKKWDALSITRFPIGQGILVSPLQLVRAYCALANGGELVKLRLVDRIEDPDSGKIYKFPIRKDGVVIKSKEAVKQIVDMMKLVTQEGGTALAAGIPGYDVAGKTGTSQKWVRGGYSGSEFFATFIGFVPADDPAFVLLVTADEPQKNHFGGIVAAPAFRDIAQKTLRYLDIQPTKPIEEKTPGGKAVLARNHQDGNAAD